MKTNKFTSQCYQLTAKKSHIIIFRFAYSESDLSTNFQFAPSLVGPGFKIGFFKIPDSNCPQFHRARKQS